MVPSDAAQPATQATAVLRCLTHPDARDATRDASCENEAQAAENMLKCFFPEAEKWGLRPY